MRRTFASIWALLASITVIESAHAKNQAVIFGGACDPAGSEDSMLLDFRDYREVLKANWDVELLYGKVKNSILGNTKTSTRAELLETLDRLGDPEKGLKPGDQFLMIFVIHGRPSHESRGRHSICLADGAMEVDDPELVRRFDQIKRRGAQLTLIDESCYSGSSIDAWANYGCVITSQSFNRVSRFSPGLIALSLLQKKPPSPLLRLRNKAGITAEDLYLSMLADVALDELQPQINTDLEQVSVGGLINSLVLPHEETLAQTERVLDALVCKGDDPFEEVLQWIGQFKEESRSAFSDKAVEEAFQFYTNLPAFEKRSFLERKGWMSREGRQLAAAYGELMENKRRQIEIEKEFRQKKGDKARLGQELNGLRMRELYLESNLKYAQNYLRKDMKYLRFASYLKNWKPNKCGDFVLSPTQAKP